MKTPSGFHWVLPVTELQNRSSLALLNLPSDKGLKHCLGESNDDAPSSKGFVASRENIKKRKGLKVSQGGLGEGRICRENRTGHGTLSGRGEPEGTGGEWARKPRKLLADRRAGTWSCKGEERGVETEAKTGTTWS